MTYERGSYADVGSDEQAGPDPCLIETHRWKINKTFIELNESDVEEESKRSHSDNEGLDLLKSAVNSDSSSVSEAKGQDGLLTDLHKWHKTWISSESDSYEKDVSPKVNSDSCMRDGMPSTADNGKYGIDLERAFEVYKQLQETVDSGVDIRDAIIPVEIEITKFIPRGPQNGEMLSVGSVPHLFEPIGTLCKPCGFHGRGKCCKMELCLFCHFTHKGNTSGAVAKRGGSTASPTKPTAAKLRRDRRKRDRAKVAASKEAAKAGGLALLAGGCSSSDEADDDHDDFDDEERHTFDIAKASCKVGSAGRKSEAFSQSKSQAQRPHLKLQLHKSKNQSPEMLSYEEEVQRQLAMKSKRHIISL